MARQHSDGRYLKVDEMVLRRLRQGVQGRIFKDAAERTEFAADPEWIQTQDVGVDVTAFMPAELAKTHGTSKTLQQWLVTAMYDALKQVVPWRDEDGWSDV